jgi:MFS family permease
MHAASHTESPRSLRLLDYCIVQGVSSFAFTLLIMCIFFWTRTRYGFSHAENLSLGALGGGIYMLSARYGGILGDRLGYNRVIAAALACAGLCLLGGWFWPWRYAPFVMHGAYVLCMAAIWPSLEAAVLHVPGSLSMPKRLGIYNMIWSSTAALGFFVGGFLFAWTPSAVVWVPGLLHLGSIGWMALHYRPRSRMGAAAMDLPHRGAEEAPERKRLFTYMSWNANTLAYFMVGAFSALTPFLGERLGVAPSTAIWIACTPLLARAVSFLVFWLWESWHYHMAWSLAALWLAPCGLALLFFGPSVPLVLTGAVAFGLAVGLSYYTSIYYTLDFNTNKGEGGGRHESLIGMGMLVGPLAGALAAAATGSARQAQFWVLLLAVLLSLLGMILAVVLARRKR